MPIWAARTRTPPAASGIGSRLPQNSPASIHLREGAVCLCNKGGCRDYFKGEKKRKLKEAMFQGSANNQCLPKQYRVKKVNEILGIRYARVDANVSLPRALRCPLRAAGTPTLVR